MTSRKILRLIILGVSILLTSFSLQASQNHIIKATDYMLDTSCIEMIVDGTYVLNTPHVFIENGKYYTLPEEIGKGLEFSTEINFVNKKVIYRQEFSDATLNGSFITRLIGEPIQIDISDIAVEKIYEDFDGTRQNQLFVPIRDVIERMGYEIYALKKDYGSNALYIKTTGNSSVFVGHHGLNVSEGLYASALPGEPCTLYLNGVKQESPNGILFQKSGDIAILPINDLSSFLGNNELEYLHKQGVTVDFSQLAYLKVPVGYDIPVTQQNIYIPVTQVDPERLGLYQKNMNVAYAEVQYAVGEKVNYRISYSPKNISITTDGSDPYLLESVVNIDQSKIVPTDPTNPYNLSAFKEGRSLALLPKARWDEVIPPTGVDEGFWNRLAVIDKGGLVMVEGKLSDIPSGIKMILDGEESWVELTIASIDIDDQGLLNSSISGAPVMILFNDGTSVQINSGQDPSIGHDAYGNYFPNKGINDISCILFADTGSASLYILQVTGE